MGAHTAGSARVGKEMGWLDSSVLVMPRQSQGEQLEPSGGWAIFKEDF